MQAAETALRTAMKRLPYSTKISFALAALYERHRDDSERSPDLRDPRQGIRQEAGRAGSKVRIARLDFTGGEHQEAERRLAEVLKAVIHARPMA